VLRYVTLKEWVVDVIKSMYAGATIAVKMINDVSKEFEVKGGVH